MNAGYRSCCLCPRRCAVDRAAGTAGYCGEGADLRIAAAVLHTGEEPALTCGAGSGAVFITGCNLGCTFCQNAQISQKGMGRAVSIEEFARVCLELERRGAANANIVTGSHAIPAIAAGLRRAREKGFTLPVVWNSSAYETVEALMLLDNGDPETRLVDIWLPDLKTQDGGLSRRYFAAPDYPAKAAAAILFMLERTPLVWEGTPCASALKQGVIIRHLALPGMLAETRGALKWFAENARGRALLSLMTQYTPVIRHETKDGSGPAPQRYLDEAENTALLALLDEFGIDDGYVQDLAPDDGWLPDFNRTNPFSPALSVPVWHWKTGFVPAPSPQGNVKKQQ